VLELLELGRGRSPQRIEIGRGRSPQRVEVGFGRSPQRVEVGFGRELQRVEVGFGREPQRVRSDLVAISVQSIGGSEDMSVSASSWPSASTALRYS
jgi:hypothetical protein